MTVLRGWTISVGLVLAATAANAQTTPPPGTSRPGYVATSDFSGPYADVPAGPPAVVYSPREYGPAEYGPPGYAPSLLPRREVYTVLREHGFSPLGAPQLRGTVYSIVVVDRRGDDGRLLIDARNGQIVRFVPGYRTGERFEGGRPSPYGYGYGRGDGYGYGPAPMNYPAGPPRPPTALPREASHTTAVPMPKAASHHAGEDKPLVEKQLAEKPLAEKPTPQAMQQSAAVQGKAADAAPQAPPPVIEAKPASPAILPTQPMPKVQPLE